MRFFITFQYQGKIFEEAFDAPDWSKAYEESRNHVPPQAVTLGITYVKYALSKINDDMKQSTTFYSL